MKKFKSVEEFIEHQELWKDELIELREVLVNTELKEEAKREATQKTRLENFYQ